LAPAVPAAGAGSVPQEILERPIPLRTGIGRLHEAVTTSSREAQAFYDQGLAYLHSYVWIDAARSFHQALRLDPKVAMAQVGLSIALYEVDGLDAARAALVAARAVAVDASERERQRIELRALQLDVLEHPKDPQRLSAYRRALDAELRRDSSGV